MRHYRGVYGTDSPTGVWRLRWGDYSSEWAGIEGFGSNDVLQAGIEADAYCNQGSKYTFYSARIEWYPNYESRVTVPSINPGDVVYVQVWNASSTVGYAFFYDFSTLSSAEYQLTAPSGTRHWSAPVPSES